MLSRSSIDNQHVSSLRIVMNFNPSIHEANLEAYLQDEKFKDIYMKLK